MAEILDLYNQYRQHLKGQTIERGNKLDEGTFHLVAHVCIFNQQGEMLIQQRKYDKKLWPGLWDFSAAGAVMQGETSNIAAQREIKEELDLDFDLTKMRPQLSMTFPFGFDDVYLIQAEVQLNDIHIEKDEVEDIRFAGREEILTLIEKEKFINYKPGLIELIFDSLKAVMTGCINKKTS